MIRSCLALFHVLVAASAVAGQTPKSDLLARVPPIVQKALASGRLRYSGLRTVQFGAGTRATSHVEIVLHDGDRTRIEFLENTPLGGQVIVEDSRQRLHYFPKRNEIEVLPPRNDVTMVRLSNFMKVAIRRGWRIQTGPGDQVAGVNVEEVYAQDPRGNVRQRFWIDSSTGMILKRVIYDNLGAAQGSFEFTQIDYNPRFKPSAFAVNRTGVRTVTPEMRSKRLAIRNGLDPVNLPADSGYRMESVRMVNVGDDQALCQLYSGTDGQFSLFHLKKSVDSAKLQKIAGGRFRVFTWQRNGETLALVGEIDERKLQEIARQLGGP